MNLGKKAEDRITGFTGTITGYVQYITGCNQYLIMPRCKKGEENTKPDGHWVDDNRVTIFDNPRMEIDKDSSIGADLAPPKE